MAVENRFIRRLIEVIAGKDPAAARQVINRLPELPPEAIESMQQMPVGEITVIPVPLPRQEP